MMYNRKWLYFTRRKISFFLIPSLLFSLIFILYQITIFVKLSKNHIKISDLPDRKSVHVHGTHKEQARHYTMNAANKFVCITSQETIDFVKVNDDYCDCLDGSDEPGTNACPNGKFYCTSQTNVQYFVKSIESSKVNDGICDCCDGSDEWKNNEVLQNFNRISQKKANRYHVPCPKMC